MKNAARLWSTKQEAVPVNYSANHNNSSCWNSDLYLNVCGGRNVEGHINSQYLLCHLNYKVTTRYIQCSLLYCV